MSNAPLTVDFGAPTAFGAHLFRVEIPAGRTESVVIIEDYGYRGQEGGFPRDEERVALQRHVWSAIADTSRREFNDRLKAAKVTTGRWHSGTNLVDRLLGKELWYSPGPLKLQTKISCLLSAASGRHCGQRNAGGFLQ